MINAFTRKTLGPYLDAYTDIYESLKDLNEKLGNVSGNSNGINSRVEEMRERQIEAHKSIIAVNSILRHLRIIGWVIAAILLVELVHHW
jgi:hypothetical protein